MTTFESFRDIDAWKIARRFTKRIYRITSSGDLSNDFGLRDQLRRSAVSVMSNIAEGFERDGKKEFIQYLSNAKGSAGELESQLIVANDVGYLSDEVFDDLLVEVREASNKIGGLIRYLKDSDYDGTKYN